MRDISSQLQAHLASGATTMCHCWRLRRRDGVIAGFTDHDRDLQFDGTIFGAQSGMDGARSESNIGLAVSGTEISGVLESSALTEADLANGLYDDARVEIWRVNWANVDQRFLIDVATVGEVRRSVGAFTAELRSQAHLLDQERGRLFEYTCAADLGDARCKVDVSDPAYCSEVSVGELVSARSFSVAALDRSDGWFSGGRVRFLDGANAGSWKAIAFHRKDGAGALVSMWTDPAAPLAAGDHVRLEAGCDKSAQTCRVKFANFANFRGFPHIPGNDALLAHPGTWSGPLDGGSMFR